MSKSKPFNGAPEGAAPAQGYNQGVYDNPPHGVSRGESNNRKGPVFPASNDPHYTQKSEPGNDGHSGLPHKSDGSYRDSSDLKQNPKK